MQELLVVIMALAGFMALVASVVSLIQPKLAFFLAHPTRLKSFFSFLAIGLVFLFVGVFLAPPTNAPAGFQGGASSGGLILLLAAMVIYAVVAIKRRNSKIQGLELELADAAARVAVLEPYQVIVDAEAEAGRILAAARKSEDAARATAEGIISRARDEAQAIAGEALAAKGRAGEFEKAATAFKNIINGYGDEYLVPTRNFLDDLADGFGHAEAAQKLKEARANTAALVKRGRAAVCEYTEDNRRNTAIAFVIDAFGGKVDAILAKVKSDNAGKLRQAIMDAFAQVNYNGKPFRNARITQEFLEARLEELRWGVALCELRDQEREEQRQIREQMREEEKARREYERSLKAAQAEEAKIQVALEKAKAQAAQAGEEQKAKYEAQIQELMAKLAEAENKEARALSMAQQTKAGHVYVISNIGSFGDQVLKIGMTRRLEPLDRVKELGDASVPFFFDVHAMIYSQDAPALEAALHRRFNIDRMNKVNFRKEFFKVGIAEVKKALDEMKLDAQFTLAAEAREYRETLAIDQLPEAERLARLNVLLRQEESAPAVQDDDDKVEAA